MVGALFAFGGTRLAGGDARFRVGMVVGLQAARMPVAFVGARDAQFNAFLHSRMALALFGAFAAEFGAGRTGVDAVRNFLGHCHPGFSWTTRFGANPRR
jgi:hypothetical protein